MPLRMMDFFSDAVAAPIRHRAICGQESEKTIQSKTLSLRKPSHDDNDLKRRINYGFPRGKERSRQNSLRHDSQCFKDAAEDAKHDDGA
jgi:hypothetical protein